MDDVGDISGEIISIHAPRAGSDLVGFLMSSTLSNFNPRSPCGERLCAAVLGHCRKVFQSTLPVRGATAQRLYVYPDRAISIHAPRAGSDFVIVHKIFMS